MPTWAKMIPYLRIENLKNHTLSRGTYIYSPPRRGSLHALYIVAPDPAVIKPVCKYSRQVLITNNVRTFFFAWSSLNEVEQRHIQHGKQSTDSRVNSYISILWCQNDQKRKKPIHQARETKARSNSCKKHRNVSRQTYSVFCPLKGKFVET